MPEPIIDMLRELDERAIFKLVFVFFKEKIFLGGIIGPNVLYRLILVAFILYFL